MRLRVKYLEGSIFGPERQGRKGYQVNLSLRWEDLSGGTISCLTQSWDCSQAEDDREEEDTVDKVEDDEMMRPMGRSGQGGGKHNVEKE